MIETHPLPPFLPENAKLLMLGSFPPPHARWNMDFYYPNFQNDMWRIFGMIWFGDKNHFVDVARKSFKEQEIRQFLQQTGIAIYDTAEKVIRQQNNAADKFLQIVQPIDLAEILAQIPDCMHILTTGELATQTLLSLLLENTIAPKIGQSSQAEFVNRVIHLHRLPSSSRAYPLALEKKAAAYRAVLQGIFRLPES
ncbi:uracil-DNA glycosylase family protein [Neisseriaceae bacterium B1]